MDKTSCRLSGDFHDGPGHIGRSAILRDGGKGLLRLSLARQDWRISDFSGNYAILDMSGCPQAPVPGDHIHFIPSYWAVARTCRMPHIRKTLIHDTLPGRSLSDSRPAAPHQETVPFSEVS